MLQPIDLNKSPKSTKGFLKRLSLTVIMLNLLVYTLAGVSLYQSRIKYEKQAAVSTQNLASVLERYIEGEIHSIDIALFAVKQETERQLAQGAVNKGLMDSYISRTHSRLPGLQGMRMTDSKGDVLYGTGLKPGTIVNIADRDYHIFERDNSTGELFISKPAIGRTTNQWTFHIARRVNNRDGSFAGTVYGTQTIDYFVKTFSGIDVGKKGSVSLRNNEMALIARYPELANTIGTKTVSKDLSAMIKAGKRSATYKALAGIDNTERMISYRKISDFPLAIIVALAKDEYLADWRKEVQTQLGLVALFTLATIFSSKMLFTRWNREKEVEAELRKSRDELELRVERRTADLNKANEQLVTELAERKQAEMALNDSRQQLMDIIDFLPDATFVIDSDMKVIAWNRAMEEMTGVAKEDMLGKGDHAYTVPFYGEKRQQLIDLLDIDDAELKNKYSNITRKGRTLYAETASPALYGGKGAYVWAIGAPLYDMEGKRIGAIESIRDITEKKIAEELRNNDLALIESLLLNSPAGIRVFDAETGQCILVNQSASDIAGGPREALLEQNFRFLESWKVSGLLTLAEQVLADGVPRSTETVLHTSFEKEVPVTYQMSRFIVRERQNLLVIGRDISEERRLGAEKKQIEEQMLHAQKLESMGVLAGGIAHDFNNILTAIIGNADLALMRLNPESPVLENLQRIEKAAGRASELAKQMLAYSGKGRFVIESIDLNRLVEEMLHMLEVSISKNAVLRLNLHKPLPTVEADATQMRQVIMNLVINASEAISEKSGVIAITSGCMECDRNYLKDVWLDENLTDGLYVYLEIADSGCGMNKETMGKIFDPFFTTKFTGRGLGMAAVLGIIRGHKGAIKVYSEPGKGSSFKILLPASSKPEEIFNAKSDNDSWKGSGTVLLVDDEETIRALGSEMLREIGFQVVTAEDGRHALEIFNSRDDISFVILDLTMPHMDGEQTFRELRRLKPDIKVIMSSGYNEQEVTQKFVGKGLAGFIQKPYKLSMIRDVIYKLSI